MATLNSSICDPTWDGYDTANGILYVLGDCGSLSLVDPVTGSVIGNVALPADGDCNLDSATLSVALGLLAVNSVCADGIYLISTETNTYTGTFISVGCGNDMGEAFDLTDDLLFVTDYCTSDLYVYSLNGFELADVETDYEPSSVTWDSTDDYVFVAAVGTELVDGFYANPTSNYDELGTIEFDGNPQYVAYDPLNQEVLVTVDDWDATSHADVQAILYLDDDWELSDPTGVGNCPLPGVVDDYDGNFYVADNCADNITGIDMADLADAELSFSAGNCHPYSATVDTVNDTLYTTTENCNELVQLSPSDEEVLSTIQATWTCGTVGGVWDPDLSSFLASSICYDGFDAGVSLFNPANDSSRFIPQDDEFSPSAGVYDPETNTIFAIDNWEGIVDEFNATTGEFLTDVPDLDADFAGITYDPSNGMVYVSEDYDYETEGGGEVVEINPWSATVVNQVSLTFDWDDFSTGGGIAYSPNTGTIFVVDSDNYVIDDFTANGLSYITQIEFNSDSEPGWVTYDPVSGLILITAGEDGNTVEGMDPATLDQVFDNTELPFEYGELPAVDPVSGDLYVPDYDSTTVAVLLPSGILAGTLSAQSLQAGIYYDPLSGQMLDFSFDGSVTVISTELSATAPTLAMSSLNTTGTFVPSAEDNGVWEEDGAVLNTTLYVATDGRAGTSLVDLFQTSTGAFLGAIPLVSDLTDFTTGGGAVADPSNGEVYIPGLDDFSGDSAVAVISGTTGAVVNIIDFPGDFEGCPNDGAYNVGTGDVLVYDACSGELWSIDSTDNQPTDVLNAANECDNPCSGVAVDPTLDIAYIVNGSYVTSINLNTNATVSTSLFPNVGDETGWDLAYDPANQEVYVSLGYSESGLDAFSASTLAPVAYLPIIPAESESCGGGADEGVVYDAEANMIVSSNWPCETVDVFNPVNQSEFETLWVSYFPEGITYDPVTGNVFATSNDEGFGSIMNSVAGPTASSPQVEVGEDFQATATLPGVGSGNVTLTIGLAPSAGDGLDCGSTPEGLYGLDQENYSVWCQADAAGNYTLWLNATDSAGNVVSAWTPVLVGGVGSAGALTITSSALSGDDGQTVTFSALATGGYPPYAYTWYNLPSGTCTPTLPGTVSCVLSGATGATGFDVWATATGTGIVTPLVSLPILFTEDPDPTVYGLTADVGGYSVNSADVGQSVTFSVSATAATTLLYTWTALPAGCTSISWYSITCTPSLPGSTAVTMTVTDTNGVSATTSLTFPVYADPTVTNPVSDPMEADVGQSLTFVTLAGGGTGTYLAYSWTESAAGLGCTASSWSGTSGSTGAPDVVCTPTAPGIYTLDVWVLDSNAVGSPTATSASIYVNDTLSAGSVTATTSSLDYGQSVTFSTTAGGGSGILTFNWFGLPAGCASVDAASVTCVPLAGAGTYTVYVTVTDSLGTSATSGSATVTVSTDPSVTSPSGPTLGEDGQTLTLSVTPTGGAGSLTVTWHNLPTGCTATSSTVETCVPTAGTTGSFDIYVTVTDANGVTVTSGPLWLTLVTALGAPTVSVTSSSSDAGQSFGLAGTVAGGVGPYTYQWTGLPTGCLATDSAALTCAATTAGDYNVTLTVTDAQGVSETSAPTEIEIATALHGGSLSASLGVVEVGQSVTWTITVLGGTGTDTASWTGLPSGCTATTALDVTCTTAAAGELSVGATVTDAAGAWINVGPSLVTVDPALGSVTLSASATQVVVGQTFTLVAALSGGTDVYTYSWTGLPDSGCSGLGSPDITCVASSAATLKVNVSVTDSTGAHTTSNAVTITVAADLSSALAANVTAVVVGNSATLTVTASGGFGPYTYTWLENGTAVSSATGATLTLSHLKGGVYSVSVIVHDANGDATTSPTVTVIASLATWQQAPITTNGNAGLEYGDLGLAVVALILSCLAILLVLLRRKQKTSRGPATVRVESAPATPPPPEPKTP